MLKPKKSLGQNFLRDGKVLEKIIESANLNADDFVIEVGPGEGILTEKLAEKVSQVASIEIDQNLIPNLEKKFSAKKNIEIINADILKINLDELLRHSMSLDQNDPKTSNVKDNSYKLKAKSYKVVANIPYYITSKIIRLFLENENPPTEMILMVQKEVAERITAKAGKMSLLSVSVQYYANAELLFTVSGNSFFPVPEVDSAVIKVESIKKKVESREETWNFFRVVKAGFSAKRKTLVNNLCNSLHLEKSLVEEKLKTVPLSGTVRAQELSIEDWKKLTNLFEK